MIGKRKRIFIFGTGKYYKNYYKWIKEYDIIALVDNNADLHGTILDGHDIISPQMIKFYEYDGIYILNTALNEIREQLLTIGVPEKKIFYYFQLESKNIKLEKKFFYSKQQLKGTKNRTTKITMISHDFSITGAQKCLLLAAKILINRNCHITVASPYDGKLKEDFLSIGANVIVDERLRVENISNIEWLGDSDILFINTVQLYYLLLKSSINIPVIWWVHEPETLYKSVLPNLISSIVKENLKIYTVSEIAEAALYKTWPNIQAQNFLYGIPDNKKNGNIRKSRNSKMRFVTVGTISKIKGHDILLQAISLLEKEEKGNIEFLFIGKPDTDFGIEIASKIRSMDLPVLLCGEMENSKVLNILDTSDVLICASRIETMSMAVTEGMMKEVAVIVSSKAGIARYIEDGKNGLVFQSGNEKELKEKMSFCIRNRDYLSKMGKIGRNTYLERFSLGIFEKNLEEIVEEAKTLS